MKLSSHLFLGSGLLAFVFLFTNISAADDPKGKPNASTADTSKKEPTNPAKVDYDEKKLKIIEQKLRELEDEQRAARLAYIDVVETARAKVQDATDSDARKTAMEDFRKVVLEQTTKFRKLASLQRKLLTTKHELLRKKYQPSKPKRTVPSSPTPEFKAVKTMREKLAKAQDALVQAIRTHALHLRNVKAKRDEEAMAKLRELEEGIATARQDLNRSLIEYRKAVETQMKARTKSLQKKNR
ncbi:MAG: hypothetical protein ACFCD0_28440 [Gemmataceae bacterium]